MSATKEELKKTLDEAEWSWLKPHLQRDAVILVASDLDLLEVGMVVANDQKSQMKSWIEKGKIYKPTPGQTQNWDQTPSRRFLCLVIQPYVLIQEFMHH